MLKRLIAAAALLALINPAFAGHCPADIKAIDAALDAGGVDDETAAEAQQLRDEGEELHNAGKHEESLEVLHEAIDLLGLEHN